MTTGRINQVCALPNAAAPKNGERQKAATHILQGTATGKDAKICNPCEDARHVKLAIGHLLSCNPTGYWAENARFTSSQDQLSKGVESRLLSLSLKYFKHIH